MSGYHSVAHWQDLGKQLILGITALAPLRFAFLSLSLPLCKIDLFIWFIIL
jgi:hypothetical protein